MGLMLETSSDRLSQRGGPHFGSPDKVPAVRLRVIEDAGRLAIPFTTGILVGIGETAGRARRVAPRDPRAPSALPPRPGGHRPELPGQARDGDARRARAGGRGVPRHRRDGAGRVRTADARPGAAEPVGPRAADPSPRGRDRRLGRRLAAHARPREPRAPVAGDRGARPPDGRTRARAPRAPHDLPGVRAAARSVPRGQDAGAGRGRDGPRRPGRRTRSRRRSGGRTPRSPGSPGPSSSRSRRSRGPVFGPTPRSSTGRPTSPNARAPGTPNASPRAGSRPRSGRGSPTPRRAGPSPTRRPSRCSGPRATTSRRCAPSPTGSGATPSATTSPTS